MNERLKKGGSAPTGMDPNPPPPGMAMMAGDQIMSGCFTWNMISIESMVFLDDFLFGLAGNTFPICLVTPVNIRPA